MGAPDTPVSRLRDGHLALPVVALAAGAGALIGAMSTTLHIRVFRYRGHTQIALKAD